MSEQTPPTEMTPDQAIAIVARQVVSACCEPDAIGGPEWGSYPEIGENDWVSIEGEIARITPRPPSEEFNAAYELLEARAVPDHLKAEEDDPQGTPALLTSQVRDGSEAPADEALFDPVPNRPVSRTDLEDTWVGRITGPEGIGGGTALMHVHSPLQCEGRPCVIHHPSDHHMRGWPMLWRADLGIMERTCPHGIGHPDPDDLAFHESLGHDWLGVHGCDRCCTKPTNAVEPHTHGGTDAPECTTCDSA
jgi:hypothetical protein